MLDRRTFLIAGTTLATLGDAFAAGRGLQLGPSHGFSFEQLVRQARTESAQPYVAPKTASEAILHAIDYDAWGAIHFKTDDALFVDGPGQFPVTFFALGRYFHEPARMFVVAGQGADVRAREIAYRASDFDMPADSPARRLPADAGFAGFRFQESRLGDQKKLPWRTNDWVAFLGASYFRAIGALYQYGLSARGIAINTAVAGVTEEFPRFTRFYFETPTGDGNTVTVYAFLEGASVTGAYRFVLTRDQAVLMDIEAHLFLRRDVQRLGIAPLTSMYWFSETAKKTAVDWRPEVHDSDGLAMWTGVGEYIWRALDNPAQPAAAAFVDDNPRGFGLCQRDRDFNHYLDGVHFERRPTLWVEPKGGWGRGTVQLIELPTDKEYDDNTVAMWVPAAAARAGQEFHLNYRLHWVAKEPFAPDLGLCQATRLGLAHPEDPKRHDVRRFVVEFQGGPLKTLPAGIIPEAIVTASRGDLARKRVEAVPDGVAGHWRASFDLTPDGSDPTDLRLYLRLGSRPLTETWMYTYRPF
ncbi:MAG: glucan biosynthesis protein D [Burkholderiaceae bacterium]|nr:MAG: glucan biosynthesis protein D [Burkholderiaceae bacterium]